MRIPRSAVPLGFAAAAFVAVLWITRPPGPGLDPDAMSYLGAAESFAEHGTLRIPVGTWDSPDGTEPLGHFPPGFSLALAAPIKLGADPIQAARALEAVSAAAAAGVVVWLASLAGGALGAVLTGAVLFVTPAFALDHLRVLSEPLFLALLVLTLAAMVRAPDRPLLHGVLAAVAGAVRYAGASLAGAAALWALARPGTARARVTRAVLALAPGALVQVAWTLRTRAEEGKVRSFGLKGDVGATLREGWETLTAWLAPGIDHTLIRSVVAVVVAGAVAWLVWRARRRERALFLATGIGAACYAGLVLFSRLFADSQIPLDERMLSPFFLFASLAAAVAAALAWQGAGRAARWAGAAALAVWLVASAWRTDLWIRDARNGGWGYAGDEWLASDLVRWLRTDGTRYRLYTDNPAGVWFATGRRSWKLPEAVDEDTVRLFGAALRRWHGAVIGFSNPFEPLASPPELAARLGLVELARFGSAATVWAPRDGP